MHALQSYVIRVIGLPSIQGHRPHFSHVKSASHQPPINSRSAPHLVKSAPPTRLSGQHPPPLGVIAVRPSVRHAKPPIRENTLRSTHTRILAYSHTRILGLSGERMSRGPLPPLPSLPCARAPGCTPPPPPHRPHVINAPVPTRMRVHGPPRPVPPCSPSASRARITSGHARRHQGRTLRLPQTPRHPSTRQ
jgi:hypothetical protein